MSSFWQYLNGEHDLDPQGLTEGLAEHFAELVARGHSIADLLGHYGDDFGHLTAERLSSMHRAYRHWQAWLKRRRQLEQAREEAQAPPLPESALRRTTSPDQLDAIQRAARLCPLSEVEDQATWEAVLCAGLELWQRCVATARKHGTARCEVTDPSHPQADSYEPYLRAREELREIAPHRWLAMRRGAREGVLQLTLELPADQLLEQAELLKPRLGPTAADRDAASLLAEVAGDDLVPWLTRILDSEAEEQAISAAAASLAGLLCSAPLQVRRLGAVYVSTARSPAAAVVADRDGEVQAHKTVRAQGDWATKIVDFLQDAAVDQVVLPTSAPASELLSHVENAMGHAGCQLYKVRPAALAEARLPLTSPPRRLGASIASALVLARRALDPLKEWSAVDPVSIGVAEYQNDLDQERLRAVLRQTMELCRLERRRNKPSSMGTAIPRGAAAMARLNPLVKTLADLRPGMTVNGVVTNISHFGAFINIGLAQEGLAHISELSDEYVNDPNEVVSIGQQVSAHVLQVDPSRGRISLSLKKPRPTISRDLDRGPRPPRSKAEALASLERLFKK